MYEFLISLSSGQPLLWAVFVLGVMAAASLSLTVFWGTILRAADWLQRGRRRAHGDDVLS